MSNTKSRRDALKMSLGVLVGLPAVGVLNACTQCSKPAANTPAAPESATTPAAAATESAPAAPAAAGNGGGETLTLISETDATATALNFKHDKANVPANLQQEKTGVPFAEQSCSNCMFYSAAGQLEGGEVGSCQLLPAGKVKSGGWCASWSKKA
jgi:hypothetical protein